MTPRFWPTWRAKGAIGAVQFDRPVERERLKRAFVERGVWIRAFGEIVYLAPALKIEDEDLETLIGAMTDVIRA